MSCGGSQPPHDTGATCRDGCESNDWPRLIIGVYPEDAGVSLSVRTPHGEFVPTQGGCPGEFDFDRLLCSFSFSASPADERVTLQATGPFGQSPAHEVEMGPFNYCGRDITYVELSVAEGVPVWSAPRLISPCAGL